ncbi:MAG: haloacid dehalogenase-like hydrolase [Deltaproteobacteria bacterium]|jgi:phosphoserine phosphatase|nr:haloacid dehalogenase-like hydrolase [Deltaproteobacteria bacterium]
MVARADARYRGPSKAIARQQAQLHKQRFTVNRARLGKWPRKPKSVKGGQPSLFTRATGRKTDDTYRAVPKRVRRRLQPRVQRILKHISATGQRGPATFDGDGTLWAGDVGEGFFTWMLKNGHYPQERTPMLYRAWHGYKAGTFDGEKMYELMVTGLAGVKETRVKELARLYFDTKHRHRIYRPSSDLITALTSMGIEPWVVSGSPKWVVAAGARHLGIPAERVIGLGVRVDSDGRLTGEVVRPVPWKHGKAKRILQHVGRIPVLAAGNSYGDLQMLKTATGLSLVINPCPKTLRHARDFDWVIHRYNRNDELARSVRMLPGTRAPVLLAPPRGPSGDIRR